MADSDGRLWCLAAVDEAVGKYGWEVQEDGTEAE